jgi:gamma-glutamyl-gamma-aminobutyrate hydrolase PuuD
MKAKVLYSAVYHDDGFPFTSLAGDVDTVTHPDEIKENDSVLVVWGGSDINPELYNHPIHRTTHPGGMRDRVEWALMKTAIEKGIPIIGVCRGAQMLCAAAGGWLLQNVHDHSGHHFVRTHDNDYFTVNSIHHQMMCGLENTEHELVAWREGRKGAPYGYMDNKEWTPPDTWKEPEFVYFSKINGYAIQWHPEAMGVNCPATTYILNYINRKEDARGSYIQLNLPTCEC